MTGASSPETAPSEAPITASLKPSDECLDEGREDIEDDIEVMTLRYKQALRPLQAIIPDELPELVAHPLRNVDQLSSGWPLPQESVAVMPSDGALLRFDFGMDFGQCTTRDAFARGEFTFVLPRNFLSSLSRRGEDLDSLTSRG